MGTTENFNRFDECRQRAATLYAQILANRNINSLSVRLFTVPNFHVEDWYDLGANRPMRYKAFGTLERPEPFVTRIKFNVHR